MMTLARGTAFCVLALVTACAGSDLAVGSVGEEVLSNSGVDLVGPDRDCVHAINPSAHCVTPTDSMCTEHVAGDSGFSVQKLSDVPCLTLAGCGPNGTPGPGTLSLTRLCSTPGAQTPCGETGPKGCAVCGPVHIDCD